MTKEQKNIIDTLYREGWNPEDIAKEYGLDETEVMDCCVEAIEKSDIQFEFDIFAVE